MGSYNYVRCEYHDVRPEVADDILEVTGPYYDYTCDVVCSPTGKLQIRYKVGYEAHTYWISYDSSCPGSPYDDGNEPGPELTCADWITAHSVPVAVAGNNSVFYGTLAEFWEALDPATACPKSGYSASRYKCCNTKMLVDNDAVKSFVRAERRYFLHCYGIYGDKYDDAIFWSKTTIQITDSFPMGLM